jgi:hypothetical protein
MLVVIRIIWGKLWIFDFFHRRMLRKIFGPKNGEVTGEWRGLQ